MAGNVIVYQGFESPLLDMSISPQFNLFVLPTKAG
jgi:hypothetical protein